MTFLSVFTAHQDHGDKGNEDISYMLCELGSSWKQFNQVGNLKE